MEGLEFDRIDSKARSMGLVNVVVAAAVSSEGINGGGNSGD